MAQESERLYHSYDMRRMQREILRTNLGWVRHIPTHRLRDVAYIAPSKRRMARQFGWIFIYHGYLHLTNKHSKYYDPDDPELEFIDDPDCQSVWKQMLDEVDSESDERLSQAPAIQGDEHIADI